ncbi:MAG TPA: hypothetical protein VFH50_10035 [Acidimicrobiales bacterium]|nr:hypothetical protein [Acidimicrobiales bacterium]
MAAPVSPEPSDRAPGPGVPNRLLRGYGPVALFAVLMVLVAWLVPSKVQSSAGASSGGSGASGGPLPGTTGANGPASASGQPGSATAAPGSGGGLPGTSGSSGSAGHTVTTPANVGQCGGQTEQIPGDPYSPPCMTFSGSNGGGTSTGVTANAVNVSFRVTSDQSFQQTLAQLAGAQLADTNADTERTIQVLAQYFNSHFQFYGRKLAFHFYNGQGSLSNELLGQGQAQAEADALTAKQMGVFADMSAESEPYAADLAAQKIMAFGDPYLSRDWHQQHAPYGWSVATDGTDVAQIAADYTVQKLCPNGKPASFAGGNLKNAPRKFALLAPENSWYQVSVDVAQSYGNQHHCAGTKYTYSLDLGTMSQQAANLISKLKADGVTTIECGCDPIFPVYLSGQGAQQGYFPEFVVVGTALTDQDYVGQLYNQQFQSHAFGISPNGPTVPYTQTIGYAAYKSIDPKTEPAFFVNLIYAQMDMLAIGIQMAGPQLTPQSFQQGMFHYPPKEGPMGLWGWDGQQFTVPNDVREICWNPSTISAYNNKAGAYVGTSNQRWTFGSVPGGPPGCPAGFPFSPSS